MKSIIVALACSLAGTSVTAQTRDCRISARDFIGLYGASIPAINKVLTPCYTLDRQIYNGLKCSYRRDFNDGEDHSTFDFKPSGNLSFSTTDKASFVYYKQELFKAGFRFVREWHRMQQYEWGKYVFTPYGSVREDGDSVFVISFYKKQ